MHKIFEGERYDHFIFRSSFNVKDIDVAKHVSIIVTVSKTSESSVINQFHFQRSNFTFL